MHNANVSSYNPLKPGHFIIAITSGKSPRLVIGDGECPLT
jgi:hypothetical protein